MTFRVVVPARYASSRLPGKVLRELAGRTMLEHVWRIGCASGAADVVIATDDSRVAATASAFGADVEMTASEHQSGTDRVNEVVARRQWDDEAVVVSLQGDEPLMPPALVGQVAEVLGQRADVDIATACVAIDDAHDWASPNVVKVVRDSRGDAIYFSRASIPFDRGSGGAWVRGVGYRHIGLYAYRVRSLRRFSAWPPCALERAEALEQLRAQWHGMRIHVTEATVLPGPGVDTEDDLRRVERLLADSDVSVPLAGRSDPAHGRG